MRTLNRILRDFMMNLSEWADLVHTNAREKGWHDKERSVGDMIALMHSELSEALEEYRYGRALNEIYMNYGKPEGFPIELADVIIRILDACELWGIDITKAMELKTQYNISRSYRHGRKKL